MTVESAAAVLTPLPEIRVDRLFRCAGQKKHLTQRKIFITLNRAKRAYHLKQALSVKATYSTADLAKLFDVNESTVKRWSDTGDLECVKTRGGHRRFSVGSVLRFVHQHKFSAPLLSAEGIKNENLRVHVIAGNIHKLAPDLKEEILAGNVNGALNIVRTAFAAKPSFLEVCSTVVFPPLCEIGDEWHAKTISIVQEHVATNTVKEALTLFQSEIHHKGPNGLKALCACSEGDLHDIAIRCVGYYLETEGWHVTFLGQSTPSKSVANAIRTHKPDLVALSATIVENERQFLHRMNNDIHPAASRMRARLAVGGHTIRARFGNRLKADHLCDSIAEFESIANPHNYKHRKNGQNTARQSA